MRILRMLAIALLATFGAFQLAGCASSPNERATGQVLDDSAVTAKVKAALVKDTSVGTAMNVNVTTYRGVVQLSGFVESQDVVSRAESIAKGIEGVQSVRNDLIVNPPRR